jgi:hypothetical protein
LGGGFGLEFFESFERAVIGAAGGVYAVLEFGEVVRADGGRLSEGVLSVDAEAVFVLVVPHLGLGGAVAAEEPLAVDDFIEVKASFGGVGVVALVVVFDKLLEVG